MAAFGLGLAILLFSTSIGERFLGDWQAVLAGADLASARGYQNAHGRLDLVWGQAIRELVTPWTMAWGNGAGSAQAWAYTNTGGGLHSEFLEIFLDFGFLGVGLLLLAFGIILRRVFNLFRTATDPMGKALGLGGLCVFAAMLPCFVWQHVFNGPTSWFLLIVWGLALGAEHWASAKQAAPVRVPSSTPILRYREQLKAARLRQAAKGTQPALTVE
jgi:O-antigen ligase